MAEREDVYIRKEAFANLLLASIETYPKECTGLLFGEELIEPGDVRFDVWSAYQHQLVYDRTKDSVVENSVAYRRLESSQRKITGGVLLGGFHSHTNGNPILSDGDKEYVKGKKLHKIEIVIGIRKEGDEGSEWRVTNDDTEIQGSFPIGDSMYSIRVAGYQLSGNQFLRLALHSGYVEILEQLAEFGSLYFHTIGDLFERARNLGKDVYQIQESIKELEEATSERKAITVRKNIVKEIQKYLSP